jgi:hypothetical protein
MREGANGTGRPRTSLTLPLSALAAAAACPGGPGSNSGSRLGDDHRASPIITMRILVYLTCVASMLPPLWQELCMR